MAHSARPIIAVLALAALAGAALAAGDAAHGKRLAAGPPELAPEQACSSCHGERGEGNPDGGIPRLAAQSQDYLLRALAEYASGLRENEIMTPIAKALDPAQRTDVTAYYAALRPAEWQAPEAPRADVLRHGEILATVGSASLGVQGCMNCHGPQGRGLPPTAPYLAGQPAAYLAGRLTDWRNGPRSDEASPPAIMAGIARQLGDKDIEAVSHYFAQQPPDAIRPGAAPGEDAP